MSMRFRQSDVSYPGPNDTEGGLGWVGESVYVEDADEQTIRETTTIKLEDAGRIWFAATRQYLQ